MKLCFAIMKPIYIHLLYNEIITLLVGGFPPTDSVSILAFTYITYPAK
jgi:hypothetical protein